jgi:hypothetical protein
MNLMGCTCQAIDADITYVQWLEAVTTYIDSLICGIYALADVFTVTPCTLTSYDFYHTIKAPNESLRDHSAANAQTPESIPGGTVLQIHRRL